MALADDGDLIRGVGFVAIYAAHVEESVDELLEALQFVEVVDDRLRRAQTSQKLKEIKRRLLKLSQATFAPLIRDLEICRDLLEARHEVLHGRIYAQANGPDMLEPGRLGSKKRPVTSIELYDLANQLGTCRGVLFRPLLSDLPKASAAWPATSQIAGADACEIKCQAHTPACAPLSSNVRRQSAYAAPTLATPDGTVRCDLSPMQVP